MTKLKVTDPEIDDLLHKATTAACEVLDERFPGFENGGITTNYAGKLEQKMRDLLVSEGLADPEE